MASASKNIRCRSVSPSPRSATPFAAITGSSFFTSITEGLKKTNELLNQEVIDLRSQVKILELELQKAKKKAEEAMAVAAEESAKRTAANEMITQVDSLRHRCKHQEFELQKSTKKAQEAMELAAEESAKLRAAKEVIKSLAAQLKDMTERLLPGVYDVNSTRPAYIPNGLESNGIGCHDANGEQHLKPDLISGSYLASLMTVEPASVNGTLGPTEFLGDIVANSLTISHNQGQGLLCSNGRDDNSDARLPNGSGGVQVGSSTLSNTDMESGSVQDSKNDRKSRNSAVSGNANQVDEWLEKYEPGVYITLVARRDGTRDLKRVRFSRRRFEEHQTETWWSNNREKVYERYNVYLGGLPTD